jgi:RNA polymerase sigma factor (sigma-70 family)
MSTKPTMALGLSGSGSAGAAWMFGLIETLRKEGIDLGDADLSIGTSAGARVGAQILSRRPPSSIRGEGMAEGEANVADPALSGLHAAREHFLRLVGELRPALHRYCARVTGSVVDAEDVVQESLATAYYELSQLREMPALKPWLFRIAHYRAIDYIRRRERLSKEMHLDDSDEIMTNESWPDATLHQQEVVRAALSRFVELTPLQRGCVALKDVLDFSLEEIASMLGITAGAVKAALHRGRARLHALAHEPPAASPRVSTPTISRYIALFNARDWDGVQAMLVDDVRLELVSRETRVGRSKLSTYLTNYDRSKTWQAARVWVDGREMVGVWWNGKEGPPNSVIHLAVADGHITGIRDFVHVPYVLQDASIDGEADVTVSE